ncbi:phosphoglucosamine mutase [Millisia brevis]|uniref:phosphoglucosamine mutase n=1 Tax=Millisia brevis TaxID=264148 RepID=UPI000829FF64|nr:phosphoglucosamine mutase [Millisia brevis]
MGRLFGTDGVRGRANVDITVDLALRLGAAAATALVDPPEIESTSPDRSGIPRPIAVVGRDPRASGEMLVAAVAAGIASRGVDVIDVGVLPTPAIAYLTASYGAALGVVISASHNPMPDNGIKIFAAGGRKLEDAVEDRIEAALDHSGPGAGPTGAAVGRVSADGSAAEHYLTHLGHRAAAGTGAAGLTVVVDCANGAASTVAARAYRATGATVVTINDQPTGYNINDRCGSTNLEILQKAVVDNGADLGLAHDGDADRVLAVDAGGTIVDGDAIMAILAIAMDEAGRLRDRTLVATVMSNLGLHLAMRAAGITVVTTGVGDRYVVEALRAGSYSIGGEQSGHIVLPEHGTTGDGILTGLMLVDRMATTGRDLADLAAVMTVLPQRLINVPVSDKAAVSRHPLVTEAVALAEAELGDEGRILLRPSGTENLVRVMVEARSVELADRIADELAEVVAGV